MQREPAWRRYLRFWGADPGRDVDDELEFHLETKTEDLIASGMSPTEARREAERQFGGVRAIREECSAIGKRREIKASRMEYFSGWLRDFEYALRLLRKSKASSAVAILILTIGIGAATAVFTLLDRLLYAPLPVPNPSELLLMRNVAPAQGGKRNPNGYFPYDAYVFMRDHNATFAGLATASPYAPDERRGREKIDRPAQTAAVSSNYFAVLGVRPMLGRALAPYDDASAARVAVASYRFCSRRFGRAPEALGSVVYLNDAVGASMLNDRIRTQASGVFGALALLLITAGVYGLMAYSVARRTREIGIRVAVGSSPGRIVGLVLGESLKLVLLGVLVGVPGAVAVMKAIHGMVFGLSPVDPLSLGASVVALCLTGTAASAIPAWRAARLDPVRALRVE